MKCLECNEEFANGKKLSTHLKNRFKFRATKGKPELEVARDACVSRIYGCGSNIFKLDLKAV